VKSNSLIFNSAILYAKTIKMSICIAFGRGADSLDFILGHVKNSFILLFRKRGVSSIKEFVHNGSYLIIPVRVS